ncbi:uncharacterized protein LOC142112094 isoform X2 [Mixophyes fleayi]|uniref:uncharacterized protein LOC142112094 isoform X2 n=1 Tax=Mixophyes fleayi TaxID=3061075 RepID=UPI003F4E1F87
MPKPTEHLLAAADKGSIVHERAKDTAPRRKRNILLNVACLCGLIYLFWMDYVSWSEDGELLESLMIKAEESKQKIKSMEKTIHSLKMLLWKSEEEKTLMEEKIQYMKMNCRPFSILGQGLYEWAMEIFRATGRKMTEFMHKALEEMDFEAYSTTTF